MFEGCFELGVFMLGVSMMAFVLGVLLGIAAMWHWLNGDPDGPGGWRSRMHQYSSQHESRRGKRKKRK